MARYQVIRQEVADDAVVKTEPLHASEFDDRAGALAAAESAAKANQFNGYDEAGAFWWGRNAGGVTNRYLAVSVEEGRRLAGR